jgi:hypothetical protein
MRGLHYTQMVEMERSFAVQGIYVKQKGSGAVEPKKNDLSYLAVKCQLVSCDRCRAMVLRVAIYRTCGHVIDRLASWAGCAVSCGPASFVTCYSPNVHMSCVEVYGSSPSGVRVLYIYVYIFSPRPRRSK